MRPLDELRLLYSRHCPERSIWDDMEMFILNGYVLATPEYIIMGKAIKKGADWSLINDPTYVFPRHEQDCWFVSAFAGKLSHWLDFLPYELNWLAWQRRGSCLRYWTLNRCKTKIRCSMRGCCKL